MKDGPPTRLLDDPTAPTILRQDLAQTTAATTTYDTAAGLATLKAAIGNGAPNAMGDSSTNAELDASAALDATARGGLSLGAKLGLGTAAVAAVAGAMFSLLAGPPHGASSSQTAAAESAPAAPPKAASAETPTPHTVADETPPTPPVAAQEAAVTSQRSASKTRARAPRPAIRRATPVETPIDGEDALRREISELSRVKSLLPRDPSAAYRLAEAGHKRFGHGMLYPEREALAILALSALNREREATARARVFARKYPDSPMRARLNAALGDTISSVETKP